MDPDTYQKRDVKRRLSAAEAAIVGLTARLGRIRARLEARLTTLEEWQTVVGETSDE